MSQEKCLGRRDETFLWSRTNTDKWYVYFIATLSLANLVLLRLQRWYLGIPTGEEWTHTYLIMSVAAMCNTKSTHLSSQWRGSACPLGHNHGHGTTSWRTISLPCQSQRHQAMRWFSLVWTDWQIWQCTYSAGRMWTSQILTGSSLNSVFGSTISQISYLQLTAPSLQADSGPGYLLIQVLTIHF